MIWKVDESLRAEDVEIYYDPADLIAKLLKGPLISGEEIDGHNSSLTNVDKCPYQQL